MTDPWQIHNTATVNNDKVNFAINTSSSSNREESLEFEDNFAPNTNIAQLDNNKSETTGSKNNSNILQPLPDSASYLRSLERKLQKIQKESKLIDALGEKRQQCLRSLLQEDTGEHQSSTFTNNNELLELDTPIANSESTVQGIYRHLQPVQPLSVGEIVHILKYDQLVSHEDTKQNQETEDSDESEEAVEVL